MIPLLSVQTSKVLCGVTSQGLLGLLGVRHGQGSEAPFFDCRAGGVQVLFGFRAFLIIENHRAFPNIGALIIRIGFGGHLFYNYNKEPPKQYR